MTPGGTAATLDFARAVRDRSKPRATQVGLEHEFFVYRGTGQVDFRALLPRIDPTGRRIDPGDRHAVRRPSGLAITCDGREAEFATPPVPAATAIPKIETWARSGQRELHDLVPNDHVLWGASTHISVSVPDYKALRVARLFARTFAPALMLAIDGRDSPGLLLRPRPGRLELGGDYAYGLWLHAAAVLAIGGTLACVKAIDTRDPSVLPERVRVGLEPARERFGWYVDRSAFGPDLYQGSRAARLGMSRGGTISAQAHLHSAWCKARAVLDRPIPPALDAQLWRLIHGCEPLPSETKRSRAVSAFGPVQTSKRFGRALEWIERPGFATTAVSLTWSHAVFVLHGPRRGFACVPAEDLEAFYGALDAGELDDSVSSFLRQRPTGKVIKDHVDTRTTGLFDALVARSTVAPERDETGTPVPTSEMVTRERGTSTQTRQGKREQPPPFVEPPRDPINWSGNWWWWAATALVAILIGVGFITLTGGGDTSGTDVQPSAQPTTSAEPTPTPSEPSAPAATDITTEIGLAPGNDVRINGRFEPGRCGGSPFQSQLVLSDEGDHLALEQLRPGGAGQQSSGYALSDGTTIVLFDHGDNYDEMYLLQAGPRSGLLVGVNFYGAEGTLPTVADLPRLEDILVQNGFARDVIDGGPPRNRFLESSPFPGPPSQYCDLDLTGRI